MNLFFVIIIVYFLVRQDSSRWAVFLWKQTGHAEGRSVLPNRNDGEDAERAVMEDRG